MRRLIVTADDLGISEELDRGIFAAHAAGAVTSASLIVTGKTAHSAVETARRTNLSLGLHLCFVKRTPVCRADEIPTLTDREGRLPPSVFRLATRRVDPADLDREAEAQMGAYLELVGAPPDFVNTEQHAQLLPAVLAAVIRLCHRHAIPRTRLAAEHAPFRPNAGLRSWLWPGATALALAGRARLDRAGLEHPDCMLGGPESGRLTAGRLRRLLDLDWDGTAELVVHPTGDELAALVAAKMEPIPFHAL